MSEDSSNSGTETNLNKEVIARQAEYIKQASRPRALGILTVVFVAVLIVMIGGLASYYYYTFQNQGTVNEQNFRNSWNDVVVATVNLTNSFDKVKTFADLATDSKGGFKEVLGSTTRSLRDVLYGFQGSSNFAFSGNSFNSRLSSFLDDYLAFLRELQRVIDKGASGMIQDIAETDELIKLSGKMNETYDNLLLADKSKIIQANLPRELFDLSGGVKGLVEATLADQKKSAEADQAAIDAAVATVTKFMQAYSDRDATAMVIYMTKQAESEFQPSLLLETVLEVKSFKVLATRKMNDNKIEIDAQIDKETPDLKITSEKRLFVMLQENNKWLIDSWDII